MEPVEAGTAPVTAAPDAEAGGKTCGCSLCEPVVSDDACKTADDCAPDAVCHARACIAKAKAPVRGPNTMCTEIMMCNSTDANACGCFQGKCALMPRKK